MWYDRIRRVCEKKEAKKRKNEEADDGKNKAEDDSEDNTEDEDDEVYSSISEPSKAEGQRRSIPRLSRLSICHTLRFILKLSIIFPIIFQGCIKHCITVA